MISLAAGITAVAMSLGSYHFDRSVVHDEINPGLLVELEGKYVVGAYRNSWARTTVLVGRTFDFGNVGSVNFGAVLGGCTGYDSPVCGALTARVGFVHLIFTPPTHNTSAVVGFSFYQKVN